MLHTCKYIRIYIYIIFTKYHTYTLYSELYNISINIDMYTSYIYKQIIAHLVSYVTSANTLDDMILISFITLEMIYHMHLCCTKHIIFYKVHYIYIIIHYIVCVTLY